MNKLITKLLLGVLFVLGSISVQAQITITVTGNTNTTPNLLATYPSLSAALTDLNLVTAMTGPVVLTCDAATSETAPVKGFVLGSATLNPVLSSTNTITINKTGGVVTINAGVGTANGPSVTPDGILYLNGADHVTIDGLTFTDGNAASATVAMEFGIALFKLTAGDGCNNNTIQNCIFNMQRINNNTGSGPMLDGSYAIEILNSTAAAANVALTPTNGGTLATNGTNSGNKFYSNTINNGNGGIGFGGFAATVGVGPAPVATTFLGDLGNDVGGASLATGNTILNYGGGAATSPAAGIRANNQWSINISYNTIDNNNGGGVNHTTTLRGIFAQAGLSAAATINNNTVTVRSGATTSGLLAIENGIGSTAVSSNTINVNNNTIRFSYTTATTGVFSAISNSSTAGTINISNNNIQQLAATNYTSTGTVPVIVGGSPGGPMNITNNTISNFVMTGATGTLRAITASTPVGLYSVTGNTIENLSYTAAASTGSITGIYNLASATLENVNNNIIRNFSTPTTGTLNGIQNNTVAGTFQCQNNQIYNFTTTAGGAGGFSANGITWSNANVTISGNIIYAINSTGTTGGTGGTINGITHGGAATVSRNAIYDLSSNSTNAVINGININATGTNAVNNNLIGDLRAPNSTNNIAISGMLVASGTTNNIFHNTVNIASTTASVTTFGTSAIYFSSATPVNNLRNNIFVNTSTPGPTGGFTAAIRYSTVPTSTNFPAANNNNFYYAGVPAANRVIYCEGSTAAPLNGQQTIANYKTYINTTLPVAGREAASVSEIPNWVSTTGSNPITTFLQYNTGVATQIEQGGITGTGVTTDYAATTRCPGGGCPGAASAPDMGAWELNGIAADFTAPAISYSTLSNTLCLTDRTLTATITDPSGVNIAPGTRPRLYFKKSGNADTYVDNTSATNGWKYVEATGAGGSPFSFTTNYSLLFGGVPVATDNIQYFMVAQDLAGTPNVGINSGAFAATPTSVALTPAAFPIGGTVNNFTINGGGLTGTVTIGAAGTYPSLTGAGGLFAALNAGGLTGNLTADIIDATVAEDGSNALNQLSYGCAPFYTLLIKPGTGVNATLTGSSSTALIKLNGADYVTIDGSNNGSSSQNLTIENTATTTNTAAIWLASLGTGAGATNNTIKNTTIRAGSNTVTSTFGIFVGGASISTSGTGNDNDDLTIQNNSISKAYYGIYAAASAAARNDNMVISQNSIGSTLPAEYISFRGMLISQADNASISQNTVFNIVTATTNLRAMEFGAGFINAVVNRNLIYNISNGATTFSGAKGMSFAPGAGLGTISIRNNVIYGLNGNGSSTITNNSWGIMLESGTAYSIYYNSVNQSVNRFTTSSTANDGCMYVASAVTGIDLRNNVFSATAIAGNAGGKCYGLYSAAANTAYTNINYNDFYAPGTSNRFAGFIGSDRTTIADIQAGFGQNANSMVADPLFNSAVLLIPQTGSPLVASATPIAGVTTDILGVTRNAVTPTIGAYETPGDFAPPVISYAPIPGTLCIAEQSLSATITDASGVNGVPGTKPRLYFKKSTDANTYVGNTSGDNGWKYVEASNAASPFSFTTNFSLLQSPVVGGETIQYFVVAQDLATTPNVGINSGIFNTAPSSVNLAAGNFPLTGTINSVTFGAGGLSGTVTVGAAGTYTSLTGAGGLFEAVNTGGLTGNIIVNILDASVAESGANVLSPIAYGCGGPFTMLIKPGTGVTTVLTGSLNGGALIKILASNVTIDGSNNGSATRDMTITNTSTTTPQVLLFGSIGTIPIINSTIKNSILINGVNTSSALIVSDLAGASSPGYFNNITIQNNIIQKAYIGIFNNAVVTQGNGSGLNIINNDLTTSGASAIRYVGIYVQGADGATVSGNQLANFDGTTGEDDKGVWFAAGTRNSTISNNSVTNLNYTGTSGYGTHGFYITTNEAVSGIRIQNNFIANLSGDGWDYISVPTDNTIGIVMSGTQGGIEVDNNSINLSGNTLNQTSAMSMGMYLGAGSVANIRNNIIVNNLGLLGATGYGAVGIYAVTNNTQFAAINYNDYFVNPSGSGVKLIGQIAATGYATLPAFAAASGGDGNSINYLPSFVSSTNLHLTTALGDNWCLNGSATPIAGITVDIDGDTRNVTNPDMGADEFTPIGDAVATPSSQTLCSGIAITPIVLSGTATSFNWTRDNTVAVTGIAASGTGNISGTLTNTTASPVTVTFTITPVNAVGCFGLSITAAVTVNPTNTITLTSAPGTDAQSVCINTPITDITYATTTATGATFSGLPAGVTGNWSANVVTISGTPTTAVGSPFNYTVTLTGGGSCGTLTANGTITVNPNNTITLTSATGTDAQTACINTPITNISYATTAATGATFSGLPAGVTGNWAANVVTISGTPTTTVGSPFNYTVTLTVNGSCGTLTANGTITVTPDNTITLTSAPATTSQTLCINTAITDITYSTTGATGATFSGLPAGVTGNWAANVVTISGTPTVSGPFSYTVSLTGGCGTVTATGTITVTPDNTITLTSVAGTDAQSVCLTSPITNITYITTGATGATFSGLPAGVTGNWAANTVTISGTPSTTVGSPFSYTVSLTDGCGTVTANGTITVKPLPDISSTQVEPTTCASADGSINITLSGAAGPYTYAWTGPGVNPTSQNQTGLTVGNYSVTVTAANSCTATASFALAGPGGCSICPTIPSFATTPSGAACFGNNVTLTASGLTDMGSTFGIIFKYSTLPLANPYAGGTVIATVPNGSLTAGGTVATANTASIPVGSYYVYAILTPTPVDPVCRPVALANLLIGAVPDVNQPANQVVCNNFPTAAVNFTGSLPGTVFNWTNNTPSIGLAASGSGNIGSFTATNVSNAAVTATITVTPQITTNVPASQTFSYTGALQTFTVPAGVTSVDIIALGAQGGSGAVGGNTAAGGIGGLGASATGTLAVTPGQVLNIFVGGQGGTPTGGFNGGGNGGNQNAGGGGGASDVRTGGTGIANRVITAGGGGGGGRGGCDEGSATTGGAGGIGGNGGGGIGANGASSPTVGGLAGGGFGGNAGSVQGAFGAAGIGCGGFLGAPGFATANEIGGDGGNGQTCCCFSFNSIPGGGGGGGGQIGGGGAGGGSAGTTGCSGNSKGAGGGGGGGSSYFGGVTAGTTTAGVQSGNGQVIITYMASGITCTGTPKTFTYTVNPTPNAVATPASQTVCSGAAITTITLSGNVSGTTYNWTRDNTVSVTGIAASGSGNISGALTNTTNAPLTVTFTITPTANGCAGTPITATVLVNPTPNALATPASQTICSAATITTIALSGNVAGTTYSWTRDNTVTVTGIAANGNGNISGGLTNTTNAPVTVTFTITPSANGCAGTPITATVLVNPTPNAVATPAAQTVCSTLPITPVVLSSNVSGTSYTWVRDNTVSVTGIAASGSGNISGSLINVTAAPVTVTFTITPTANGCVGAPITATVTVTPQPAATITYAGSPYCSTDLTAPVTRTGTAGGTYSAAPAGLTINATTGTVTPATSTPGTYTVTYTIAAGGGCATYTTTTSITITAAPNIIIFYGGTPYCSNAGTANVSRFGTPGGTYSAAPAGLSINAATGAVNLGASTPGTYTVTYTIAPSGGCGTTFTTTTLTITAAPNATISYTGSPYCANAGTANVTLTGSPAGGTYSSTAGLSINAATGAVNLAASTAGTYTVTYTVAASGGCASYTTTATITITALPAATITYTGSPYCSNAGTATVTRTGTSGGTYTAAPAGLSINTATGDVNLGASTAGTYTVTYTIAAGSGCPAVTTTASITITAVPAATISYAGNPFCQPGGIVTVTRTGTAGGAYSAAPAGLTINATTGDINVTASTPGVYTVTYTLAAGGGCPAVTPITSVTINSPSVAPTAASATATALCTPGTVTLGVVGGSLGSGSTWRWYSGSCGGTLVGTGATLNVAVNTTTTYFVRAEGPCNNTACASITVSVNAQPTISIAAAPSTALLPGQTTTLTATVTPAAGNTFIWYKNGVVVPGAAGSTLNVNIDGIGTYTARVTTAAGCTALSNAVAIGYAISSRIWVYPNPNQGRFQVRYYNAQGGQTKVVISNALGQRVFIQRVVTGPAYARVDINLSGAAAGVYNVDVLDGNDKRIGVAQVVISH